MVKDFQKVQLKIFILGKTYSMDYGPGVWIKSSEERSNNSEPNQSTYYIETYFFKIDSNVVLPSKPRFPSFVKFGVIKYCQIALQTSDEIDKK